MHAAASQPFCLPPPPSQPAVPCRASSSGRWPCPAPPCRAPPCRAPPCRAPPCRAPPCRAPPCRALPSSHAASLPPPLPPPRPHRAYLEVHHVCCQHLHIVQLQVPCPPHDELPLRGAVADGGDGGVAVGLSHEQRQAAPATPQLQDCLAVLQPGTCTGQGCGERLGWGRGGVGVGAEKEVSEAGREGKEGWSEGEVQGLKLRLGAGGEG
jgi:hypothetical protein